MTTITKIHAREVLDSRGHPTVQVEVHTSDGAWGSAFVPAGASTGKAEARELRDGDPGRYDGRGVRRAVAHVNEVLAPALVGDDPADQIAVDRRLVELDGAPDKSRLGANALLGVSLAAAHAAAASRRVALYRHLHDLWRTVAEARGGADGPRTHLRDREAELEDGLPRPSTWGATGWEAHPTDGSGCRIPLPMTNMISGGLHAGGNLDFQDFLIMPVGAPSYAEGLEWIVRVANRLGELLAAAGCEGRLVADEGGYGPRLASNREAVEFVVRAIEAARLAPLRDVTIAIDVAASHFFDGRHYHLRATGDARLTSGEMIEQLEALVDDFPVTSIEDGLAEDDWDGWRELTRRLGRRVQLVGDDLFATNPARLKRGIEAGAANSVLVKVNQIGTLTEALRTMYIAREAGYGRVVSARSGETEDTTIADLAVGVAAELIKIGSIRRSERLAKYNRLLAIEEELTA